ncbi:hypothetical protein OIU84_019278 [Salix udensis]|uniref:Uncharacterized protein n=1 Tax=Salix udensis TaxID=889485 RepID=A0AAD6KYM0_9ROSI|nr:hypothetical protein OIU84_019278 [Salix udensis]
MVSLNQGQIKSLHLAREPGCGCLEVQMDSMEVIGCVSDPSEASDPHIIDARALSKLIGSLGSSMFSAKSTDVITSSSLGFWPWFSCISRGTLLLFVS